MTLNDLMMYHFHRYEQCMGMEQALKHHALGDEQMMLLELLHWAENMEEADRLYAMVKPHHERLYCESRGYALYL